MTLLDIFCSIFTSILDTLSSALPQLGSIWDQGYSFLNSICPD